MSVNAVMVLIFLPGTRNWNTGVTSKFSIHRLDNDTLGMTLDR